MVLHVKRWSVVVGVMLALAVAPLRAQTDSPTTDNQPARSQRLRAAVVYGATAGALAAGGLGLFVVAAVALPLAWALARPFPPPTLLGEPWEHAMAFAAVPWLAMGSALWVAAAGFAVMAGTQVALMR